MNDEWKRGEQDSLGLSCEWGCSPNIRILNEEAATLYDAGGHPVLCACGKPAGSACIGKEAMVAWCEECNPLEKTEAKLVYRELPVEEMEKQILNDAWTVNLVPTQKENGDTDWYCPDSILPRSGSPVYLKMQVVYKAWYTPECKLSKWILENNQVPDGKILAWQHRQDAKNLDDQGELCNNT